MQSGECEAVFKVGEDDDNMSSERLTLFHYSRDSTTVYCNHHNDLLEIDCSGQQGDVIRVFQGHSDRISSIAVDGEWIYTSSVDGTCRRWRAVSAECCTVYAGHEDWVWCVVVHQGVLYSGSKDTTIRAWNVQVGLVVAACNRY